MISYQVKAALPSFIQELIEKKILIYNTSSTREDKQFQRVRYFLKARVEHTDFWISFSGIYSPFENKVQIKWLKCIPGPIKLISSSLEEVLDGKTCPAELIEVILFNLDWFKKNS